MIAAATPVYAPPPLQQATRIALIVGVVALAVTSIGAFISPKHFFGSYLIGFTYWANIALGSLLLIMINYLTGGIWGLTIRRIAEAATRTFPIVVLLFVPIVLGIHSLYEWSHKDLVAHDEVLQQKAAYLNVPFFIIRAVVFFGIWILLSRLLGKWSKDQDRGVNPVSRHKLGTLSGPGVVIFALTITFASVDWLMSLDAHWFSTIYPVIVVIGQLIAAMAFAVIVATVIRSRQPEMEAIYSKSSFHDQGNLLLAFVMLWAYVSFSQFLIMWSANISEETPYYIKRLAGPSRFVGIALVVLHFAMPFILLLMRDIKRNARALLMVAVLLLIMRFVDLFWLVAPSLRPNESLLQWTDFTAVIAVGGLWLAFFLWQLQKQPLVPLHDPDLPEALARNAEH